MGISVHTSSSIVCIVFVSYHCVNKIAFNTINRVTLIDVLRYSVADVLKFKNKCYHIYRIAFGNQCRYMEGYREYLDLYFGKEIDVSQTISSVSFVYKPNKRKHFNNIQDISLITSGGVHETVIYLLKAREKQGWIDQWECSFVRSKMDLKVSKVGGKYAHSFAASKSVLKQLIEKMKDTIERPTSSRYSFKTNAIDSEEIFGGKYFSKTINLDTVYVDPVEVSFTVAGKKIHVSGLILREDEEGDVHGDD